MNKFDTFIVGSGMAGMSAGIYAARYQLQTIVVGKVLGGETSTAWTVENYPGFKTIDGFELMLKVKAQVEAHGILIVDDEVLSITKDDGCFYLKTGKEEYQAATIILADGTSRRHLNLPGEKELLGKGVHYCATCDAPLYKEKVVAVVGGGDAAAKGVNLVKTYAKKVYLVVREETLEGEPVNLQQLEAAHNVEVIYNSEPSELIGSNNLEKIKLKVKDNEDKELTVDGLFIEIGAEPNSTLAVQLGCQLDEKGYLKVDSLTRTSIKGVFAAGDNTNFFGSFKQDITAAALGAVAATAAYQYLEEPGRNICHQHAKVVKHHQH